MNIKYLHEHMLLKNIFFQNKWVQPDFQKKPDFKAILEHMKICIQMTLYYVAGCSRSWDFWFTYGC